MNRYLFVCLIVILACLCKPVSAQKQWELQSAAVTFTIKNAGLTVDGKFGGATASIVFDANNYVQASIEASIESKTIDTGIGSRDNHLRKEDYFDVKKFPIMTIKSKKINKLGDNRFEGTFELTLKGISKEIKIPFSYQQESNGAASLRASFEINRLDYQVGKSSWLMGDKVKINVLFTVK
jgi:polyisoprenoid-binding protein YceI